MKLKEKFSILTGTTPSKKEKDNFGDYIAFIKPPDLLNNIINVDSSQDKLSEKGANKSRILPVNSVLVSCIGNLGKVGLNNVPVAFNQQINAVLPDKDVDPKYLFYYFQSYHFKSQLENIASSTTISIINKSKFGNLEFPFVPLSEQHRIVAKIEELFSELDNGVANLEKTKDQLQTYRQSVLKHAFEGRLTENWRAYNPAQSRHAFTAETGHKAAEPQAVYHQTAQATASNDLSQETLENLPGPELLQYIKAERQRQYEQALKEWEQKAKTAKAKGQKKPAKPKKPKEMNPLTEEELQQLPELPEGWCWARLGDISNAIGGYAFKSKNLLTEGVYQVIKIANVKMGHLDLKSAPAFLNEVDEKIIEKYGLKKGDCVISLTGTRKKRDYGNVAIVENQSNLLLNQRLGAVRFNNPLYSRFFFYAMMTDIFRDNFFKYETGNVGQGNVSMKALVSEPIFLPPLSEQKQIVREIESRLSVADNLSESIDQSLQQAQSMRQSILKKAFEGKLVENEEEVEAETS